MSKTYSELLAMAQKNLYGADFFGRSDDEAERHSATNLALIAIARILLAHEKRIAKEAEQYDT